MVEGFASGKQTRALTEFIDIYPTLCDLTGINKPDHLEGKSFLKILRNPTGNHSNFAISRFKSGDTIRTDRYRFTQYTTTSGKLTGRMLYDHERDPQENINIADNPENTELVQYLSTLLEENMGR